MALDTPLYLGFFTFVLFIYYALPSKQIRLVWLLVASYFFYFELSAGFIIALFGITAIAYFGAFALRLKSAAIYGPIFFTLFCILMLLPLFVFKYIGFLLEVGTKIVSIIHPIHHSFYILSFPVGVSFFTFVALGYFIDVYLKVVEPEKSLLRFALFVSFFPLVSAGPIERAGRMLPQFQHRESFSAKRIIDGFQWILLGMILKTIFAENLVGPINAVFDSPPQFSSLETFCAILWFPFYVYTDFAGYSLIAIGSAQMLGFDVMPNFHQPFLSATIPEFWRNWHISLSSWMRDYLFTPLRVHWRGYGNWGLAAALLVSFIAIGLWHEASWHFLLFGAIHGMLVIASIFTLARRNAFWAFLRVPQALIHRARVFFTFILVMMAFVIWRAKSIKEAFFIFKKIFSKHLIINLSHLIASNLFHKVSPLTLKVFGGFEGWILIVLIMIGDVMSRRGFTLDKYPRAVQIVFCSFALLILAFIFLYKWINNSVYHPFEYFKY